MDYKLKYKKYKAKYLELKNKSYINQSGGSSEKPNIYLFKADWCGHCNKFKPDWEKLKNNSELNQKINFITMDSDKNKQEINEWKIEGYPTIIFKEGDKAIEYDGNRSYNEIEKFIKKNIN